MSRYAREVHAFEPYEPVLEKFRRLLEINHINNVRIYPIGLGDRPAKLPFFKPPDSNDMTGSFVNEFDQENTQYKELEIAVGDEALQKSGLRKVDLIKIDVEGYEKPVLRGLNRTLNANLPIVAFELWIKPTSTLSFRSKEELATIFPNNYKFSIFNGEGDPFTGSYQLEESRIKFELEGRYEVVAYPAQKESQIPRAGPAR